MGNPATDAALAVWRRQESRVVKQPRRLLLIDRRLEDVRGVLTAASEAARKSVASGTSAVAASDAAMQELLVGNLLLRRHCCAGYVSTTLHVTGPFH